MRVKFGNVCVVEKGSFDAKCTVISAESVKWRNTQLGKLYLLV